MFADRLRYFLEQDKISPIEFAEKMEVQRSGISHLLSGRNNPSMDFLARFAIKFPHVSIKWLITGEGNLYNNFVETIETSKDPPTNATERTLPKNNLSNTKKLKSVLYVYDDNSFEEFKPTN